MMYHLIEDAPDGQTIIGSFTTEEEAIAKGYEMQRHQYRYGMPVWAYYVTSWESGKCPEQIIAPIDTINEGRDAERQVNPSTY